jgi:CRP/FNR family transcriptional regulator, anaerobic regulatory protein
MSEVAKKSCVNCAAASLCLPVGLDQAEISHLNAMIKRQHILKRGQSLLHYTDRFNSFYAVRYGSFKSATLNADGREQIWGFYFVGELFGFEGIEQEQYPYDVLALEKSEVCEIPYNDIMQLVNEVPSLQKQLLKLMSHRFCVDLSTPRNNAAEERLAAFLLSLSSRFKRSGMSPTEFALPLTRQDIASYLGLTIETVSRLISKFRKAQVIDVDGRQMKLKDLRKLQIFAALTADKF